jgi:hypothetical protein
MLSDVVVAERFQQLPTGQYPTGTNETARANKRYEDLLGYAPQEMQIDVEHAVNAANS